MAELTVDGVRLWYEDQGDGPPVLLLGGTAMPAAAWDLTFRPSLVAAGYRVVAFDARGAGRSDAPPAPYSVAELSADAAGVIKALDLGPCHVVGLSLGGFVAEDLAWRRPDLVGSVALIASAGRTTAYMRARIAAEDDLLATSGRVPATFDQLSVVTIALPAKVLQDDDDAVELWLAMPAGGLGGSDAGRHGQFAAERDWLRDDTRTDRWAGIVAPCLIVAFEHDLCFPPGRGREAAAGLPRARLVEIAGVAHGNGPFDAADQVGRAVVDFLAEVRALTRPIRPNGPHATRWPPA